MMVGMGVLALVPACQQMKEEKARLDPATMGSAALHAVHNEQLKGIMSGLNGLAYQRLPQELDAASQQQTELGKVAALAGKLGQSAKEIPNVAGDLGLSAEDQKVFLVLANQLRTQAETMDGQAHRGELRAVQATMTEISGTCVACHTLFRELSSPTPNSNP